MKPIVYFSREITPEKVLELYRALGKELPGKIAVKVHSGEEGNQNFLHPEFWKSVVDAVNGTVVECNTAYEGARNYTEQHRRLLCHGAALDEPRDLQPLVEPHIRNISSDRRPRRKDRR